MVFFFFLTIHSQFPVALIIGLFLSIGLSTNGSQHTTNIPEVQEEATWFLDNFLAKERVQKLVAVQARALNVGHLRRQSWLGCIWLCSPCKQRVHAHFLLLLNI